MFVMRSDKWRSVGYCRGWKGEVCRVCMSSGGGCGARRTFRICLLKVNTYSVCLLFVLSLFSCGHKCSSSCAQLNPDQGISYPESPFLSPFTRSKRGNFFSVRHEKSNFGSHSQKLCKSPLARFGRPRKGTTASG